MTKKHELTQALAKASDELVELAGKSEDEGFDQGVHDALVEKIDTLKGQIDRVKHAEKIAAALATPVPGQDRLTPRAPAAAHKFYGKIKHFQDREIDGRTVRAADQAYTAGMWALATLFKNAKALDWCKQNGVNVQKAQGEGTDVGGGFLVADEMAASIIVLREEFGIFRRECKLVHMEGDTMNWPRRTGGVTVTFTGENTALTESSVTWDNVQLVAKKAGAIVRLSTEIDQDAVIALADYVVGEMGYGMALKEDDCGFNGDGSTTYGGMRGLTTLAVDGSHNACKFTASSATWTSLVLKDLTGLMGLLPQYAAAGAKWYMSQQAFYQIVATITGTGGGNKIDTFTEGPAKRLLGYPVSIAQKLPTATPGSGKAMLFFGNLQMAALMGERRGITMARSDHRYFDIDQIGLRATERFDIVVHDMGDNTNAGPVVAMISP